MRSYTQDTILIAVLASVLFGILLGFRPLSSPDEGRYTEIPREMVATGDYVTPRLNGVKYFEKPVLMYWLTAGMIKLFGVNEWALRFWPALFTVIGCVGTYAFARSFYNRGIALASATVLSSSLLYYAHSRILILDMALSILMTLSLMSVFYALCNIHKKLRCNIALSVFFVSSACAILTKGLVGIIIPGCIIILWSLYYKNLELLKLIFKSWWGIALFLVIAVPWHVLVATENPEFFDFYFIHEQFLRFFTKIHRRYQPIWFFIPIIFLGFYPWSQFLWRALKNSVLSVKQKQSTYLVDGFLLIWVTFIILFYSLSSSKLIPYIVPVFPPLSIFIGKIVYELWNKATLLPGYKKEVVIFQGMSGILAVAFYIALYTEELIDLLLVVRCVCILICVLMLGIVATLYFFNKMHSKAVICSMLITGICMFLPLNICWNAVEGRSVKDIAMLINNNYGPNIKVICYRKYYQDLPAYLGRTVHIANWSGELDFGIKQEDTSKWIINEERFTKLLLSNLQDRVLIVTPNNIANYLLESYHVKGLRMIYQNRNSALLSKE